MASKSAVPQFDRIPDRVIRLGDASKVLGVHRSTLERLFKSGVLQKVKVSERAAGVRDSNLQQYIASLRGAK